LKIENPRPWSPADPYLYDLRLELMDGRAVMNGLQDLNLDLSPTQVLLMLELDGLETVVKEDVQESVQLFVSEGGKLACLAEAGQQTERWWRIRGALLSNLAARADLAFLTTSIVPGSKTTQFFEQVSSISTGAWEFLAIYGHMGEGRWHTVFVANRSEAAQRAASQLRGAISRMTTSLGGQFLRPHTIGFVPEAIPSLTEDSGQEKLWTALKTQFDPMGLLSALE